MSRRKTDPVDAAFDAWLHLDTDEQKRFYDRVYGYQRASMIEVGPADPKPRKPRKQKAPQESTVA